MLEIARHVGTAHSLTFGFCVCSEEFRDAKLLKVNSDPILVQHVQNSPQNALEKKIGLLKN